MFFGGRNGSKQGTEQDKVVSMGRFRNRVSLTPLRQAEAYWTALRRGDDVPSRSQVDPRGLENILSQTFIVERIAPGIVRFRLAGQKVNEMAGMEVRGMPLSAFFTPEARKQLSAAMESMFETPAIVEMGLQTETTRTRGAREAHMLLLPLRSDLGDISRALGVFVSEGNPTGVSQRFAISSIDMRSVSADPIQDMEFKAKARTEVTDRPEKAPAKADTNVVNPGFAETQTRFKAEPSIMEEARNLLKRRKAEADKVSTETAQEEEPEQPRAARGTHLRLVVSKD
ncbi:PAS domain-containing protein [Epibacterium sp. SM1979]|uniref:PAS domain-containing protein n=1 Tax=Tritonibacter litoralis TaxID=2662264 RepID=A0A843YBR9_9RHOB|nr:PAS domain-containing protein [Tritonibacter litoralis]MQQ07115.1 PAS domain-containing protein [Tritonibacter litoralis]